MQYMYLQEMLNHLMCVCPVLFGNVQTSDLRGEGRRDLQGRVKEWSRDENMITLELLELIFFKYIIPKCIYLAFSPNFFLYILSLLEWNSIN